MSEETRITRERRDSLNVWGEELVSHPIDLSDIRRWAIAVYWPETPPRLYWDEAYAKTTRWGGIVAPREFNPFAWPAERPAHILKYDAPLSPGTRAMNGGVTEKYGAPMRAGDVIQSRTAVVKFDERRTSLGLTLFIHMETRWTNQRGEWVKTRTGINIEY
jgi:hypothetical protein